AFNLQPVLETLPATASARPACAQHHTPPHSTLACAGADRGGRTRVHDAPVRSGRKADAPHCMLASKCVGYLGTRCLATWLPSAASLAVCPWCVPKPMALRRDLRNLQ